MQTGGESDREKFMPGRMEFDLVQAMAVTIERAQLRSKSVGIEAEPDGLRLAERCPQGRQFAFCPARALALHGFSEHSVAGKQIVGLERRRLVLDLEHPDKASGKDALLYQLNQGNRATCSSPVVSGQPMTRFMF